jgi:hypothetical protein
MSDEFDGNLPSRLVAQAIMETFEIETRQYQRYKKILKDRRKNR